MMYSLRLEDGNASGFGCELAFSHVSFATARGQGPSEQILIDLFLLSMRSRLNTSVNIEPVNGEYR